MVKIFLVRHGETDWNKEQVFRGKIDIPLNDTGRTQAEAVRGYFKPMEIDELYASPLSRALETAAILGEQRGLVVKVAEGFSDIDFGEWQGLSHQKVKEEFNDLYASWMNNPEEVHFPGGESLAEVQDRSMTALAEVVESNTEKTVVIVSHRVVNKVLLCGVLGLSVSHFWNVRQDTCAINCFEYNEGSYCLTLLNDTCHLKEIQGASTADF